MSGFVERSGASHVVTLSTDNAAVAPGCHNDLVTGTTPGS